MDNRLDILTKKLYEEGVEKARAEAEEMVRKAKEDAAKIIEEAKARAEEIRRKAMTDAEGMRKKAETEMTLAARQAVAALKQEIGGLVAGKVAGEMAKSGWEDRTFVEELLMTLVKKWDVEGGNLNVEVTAPAAEKERFEAFATAKYKELLDKGLAFKIGKFFCCLKLKHKAVTLHLPGKGLNVAGIKEVFERLQGIFALGICRHHGLKAPAMRQQHRLKAFAKSSLNGFDQPPFARE